MGTGTISVSKLTVSVILSDPLCRDGNSRIILVPMKALSDQALIYMNLKNFEN